MIEFHRYSISRSISNRCCEGKLIFFCVTLFYFLKWMNSENIFHKNLILIPEMFESIFHYLNNFHLKTPHTNHNLCLQSTQASNPDKLQTLNKCLTLNLWACALLSSLHKVYILTVSMRFSRVSQYISQYFYVNCSVRNVWIGWPSAIYLPGQSCFFVKCPVSRFWPDLSCFSKILSRFSQILINTKKNYAVHSFNRIFCIKKNYAFRQSKFLKIFASKNCF